MASKDTVKRSLALWDFSFERYKLGLDRGCVCMAFNASREGMWAKKGYIAAGNLYWEMPGIKLCMFLRSDHDQSVGGEWCYCFVAGQENSWPFRSFWGNKSWLMMDKHFCLPVEHYYPVPAFTCPAVADKDAVFMWMKTCWSSTYFVWVNEGVVFWFGLLGVYYRWVLSTPSLYFWLT